jgi:hypothetical protein
MRSAAIRGTRARSEAVPLAAAGPFLGPCGARSRRPCRWPRPPPSTMDFGDMGSDELQDELARRGGATG